MRRFVMLLGVLALTCAVFPSATLAYTNADFTAPTRYPGGGWLATNAKQGTIEPINVVISARSDVVKANPSQNQPTTNGAIETWLGGLDFEHGPGTCDTGESEYANVDGHEKTMAFEVRKGGCSEVAFGGYHLRGWRQDTTGAYFLAVSQEDNLDLVGRTHHIKPNGYNAGLEKFKSMMQQISYVKIEERSLYHPNNGKQRVGGKLPTDGVGYSGKVLIVTVIYPAH